MVTVTDEQLLKQCNALADDITLLELYADAAEEQVEVDTNCKLSELATVTQGESGSVTSYPRKITLAVLTLVGRSSPHFEIILNHIAHELEIA